MSAYRLDDKYKYPYQDTPISTKTVSFSTDKRMSSVDLDNDGTPSPLKDFNASLNSIPSLGLGSSLGSSASSASSGGGSSSSSSPTSRLESTMLALKDLQARVRRAQEARDDARRQRDNMRIEVIERSRLTSLYLQEEQDETKQKIISINNDCDDYSCRSNERHITNQQSIANNLDDDIMDINNIIKKLERRNSCLIEQLAKIEDNCDVLYHHTDALKCDKDLLINDSADYNKIVYLRGAISSIANQLKETRIKAKKSTDKAEKLKQYLELIIAVNSDLCTAVSAKERTNCEFYKLANQFSKPRWLWPKSIPFSDIKKFIVDAAGSSYMGPTAVKVADYAAEQAINRASFIGTAKEAINDQLSNKQANSPNSKDAIKMASGIDIGTKSNNQTILNALRQLGLMKIDDDNNNNNNNKSKKKKVIKKKRRIVKRSKSNDSLDIAAIVA